MQESQPRNWSAKVPVVVVPTRVAQRFSTRWPAYIAGMMTNVPG